VLVLSGVTTDENMKFEEGEPDYTLESVADLLSALSVSKTPEPEEKNDTNI
jgi:ribonucleotide monophosphatase NagD (HAD superfamily)